MIRTAWIYFNVVKDEFEARLGRKKLIMYVIGCYIAKMAVVGLGIAYLVN